MGLFWNSFGTVLRQSLLGLFWDSFGTILRQSSFGTALRQSSFGTVEDRVVIISFFS